MWLNLNWIYNEFILASYNIENSDSASNDIGKKIKQCLNLLVDNDSKFFL